MQQPGGHSVRKQLLAAVLLCALIALGGCSSKNKNSIAPLSLNNDQQSIVRLLNPFDDIYTYTYTMREDYAAMTVWLERYDQGKLAEKMAEVEFLRADTDPKEGQIALITRYTPALQWVVSVADKTNASSNRSAILPDPGHYPLAVPVPAELKFALDEDVTILYILYSKDDTPPTFEVLKGGTDLLTQYPDAYLLKCRFSAPVQGEK